MLERARASFKKSRIVVIVTVVPRVRRAQSRRACFQVLEDLEKFLQDEYRECTGIAISACGAYQAVGPGAGLALAGSERGARGLAGPGKGRLVRGWCRVSLELRPQLPFYRVQGGSGNKRTEQEKHAVLILLFV